jgi:Uma2 family endonuclease
MVSTSTASLMTADDLDRVPDDERGELLRGVMLPVAPVRRVHWKVTGKFDRSLGNYADANRLGDVGPEAGFLLERDPDTVLAPDISFVAAGREWPDDALGWPEMAPDLAVEVLSPSNTRREIALKVEIYLRAGVRLVWVADAEARTVVVHAAGRPPRTLGVGDALDGEDVLPGYRLPLADLFA